MSDDIILLGADSAERISKSAAGFGRIAFGYSPGNEILYVVGDSERAGSIRIGAAFGHIKNDFHGVWRRAVPRLHEAHQDLIRINHALSAAYFLDLLGIPTMRLDDRSELIMITHSDDKGPQWAGWRLTADLADALEVDVLRYPGDDPLELLEPRWPVHDLTEEVAVVGVGSIGSATALALAMYGVRNITLVDPDRLQWHNLVRHQCTRHAVGRYKVDAVSDAIRLRWPTANVAGLRHNVITEADKMRPLFRRCALVVCAADGVAPRRVVNHLARRAEKTSIHACVLMDGAFGEIIRLRPWPGWGCLRCHRTYLVNADALDPEPLLDSDYGSGTSHRPMTAVGSDLALVGQLAAKMAVATLLENAGHHDQRVRPDWALIGLRSDLTAPDLFSLYPGEVRWLPHVEPMPGCPTCGSA
jgi:molybdopterin/thiamine biosynthesis adenylyltransferase